MIPLAGHYKPGGGKCMGLVLNKLALLGIDVDPVKSRNHLSHDCVLCRVNLTTEL